MNHYPHHIGDYDSDTAHLEWAEDMAYTRLLRLYYRTERPIPSDIVEACRLVRARSKDERKAVDSVLREFFQLTDEGWRNTRADQEIERYQEKAKRNREVGKKGGRPATQKEPRNNPDGFQKEPTNNPNQNQNQNQNQEKTKAPIGAFAPPAWLSVEAWKEFEEHRKRLRKPMTDKARQLIVAELEKLSPDHADAEELLGQSIRNGWLDVFPLRNKASGTPDYSSVGVE